MNKYVCIDCDYNTDKLKYYNQHCNTIKHKNHKTISNIYICEYCSKEYTKPNSLWYHVKKCKILYDEILNRKVLEKQKNDELHEIKNEMKQEIIKLNNKIDNKDETLKQEIKEEMKKEITTLNEKIDKVKPIVFNLQIFLNEDCKNAISFDDLLQQIQFHFDSTKTLTEDTSHTLLKTLTTMTLYERPIHCVDLKRNKLVIKDNNEWTKDITVFNKLPKYVYNSYKKKVNDWTEENPDFLENDDTAELFITFSAKEAQDIDTSKIIRNISKVTTIPKQEIKDKE
jgi:hypothetical protein